MPDHALDLQRITTEYSEAEDRIRLSGELPSGEAVVLWLTQRLLRRMVPALCGWLEKQTGAAVPGALADTVQGFAQQAAVAALEPSPAVMASEPSPVWLVQAVDVTTSPEALALVFKGDPQGGAVARLGFEHRPLRQWLSIVHRQCERGGWVAMGWPEWVTETASASGAGQAAVWH